MPFTPLSFRKVQHARSLRGQDLRNRLRRTQGYALVAKALSACENFQIAKISKYSRLFVFISFVAQLVFPLCSFVPSVLLSTKISAACGELSPATQTPKSSASTASSESCFWLRLRRAMFPMGIQDCRLLRRNELRLYAADIVNRCFAGIPGLGLF